MALKKMIDGLVGAIGEAKASLAEIDAELATLRAERTRIETSPPHTDDIVAAFERGLDDAAEDFERRLSWHLNDKNATAPEAAQSLAGKPSTALALHQTRPSYAGLFPPSGLGYQQPSPDLSALAYFLRGQIMQEMPDLVAKLCPAASNGMPAAERQSSLEKVDKRIAVLEAERNDLAAQLDAARAATVTKNA